MSTNLKFGKGVQEDPVQPARLARPPQLASEPPRRFGPGPDENPRERRMRIKDVATKKMAYLRGEIEEEDDIPGHNTPPPPSGPEQQLKTRYASIRWNNRAAEKAQQDYGTGSNSKGYGITLKRILAAGGYGIAALVQHRSDRAVKRECVMKVEKARHSHRRTVEQEEKALKKYKGAKHILQILDITQEIKDKRAADNSNKQGYIPRNSHHDLDRRWDIKIQRNRDFVLTEYAEGGNLHQWLAKASRSHTRWPDKALWMLFKCLVSGLIGMGYPPNQLRKGDPQWDPNNPIQEQIPNENVAMEETAHFDLDPQNVLVTKDAAHGDFPIFKIADFGNVNFFSEANTKPEEFTKELFWKCRLKGKRWYYAPEQFDSSWDDMTDYVEDVGPNKFIATDGTKPRVAGNYGMHTNVYQIGVIMWCAITRCSFSAPVLRRHYPDYNKPIGVETYGCALQSDRVRKTDKQIRDLVQLCMAHDPALRPSLKALMQKIDDRLDSQELEPDEQVAMWARAFFNSPRTPGDEPLPKQEGKRPHESDGEDEEEARIPRRRKTENTPELHVPRVPLNSRVLGPPAPHPQLLQTRLPSMHHLLQPRYPSGIFQRPETPQPPPQPPTAIQPPPIQTIFGGFHSVPPTADLSLSRNRIGWSSGDGQLIVPYSLSGFGTPWDLVSNAYTTQPAPAPNHLFLGQQQQQQSALPPVQGVPQGYHSHFQEMLYQQRRREQQQQQPLNPQAHAFQPQQQPQPPNALAQQLEQQQQMLLQQQHNLMSQMNQPQQQQQQPQPFILPYYQPHQQPNLVFQGNQLQPQQQQPNMFGHAFHHHHHHQQSFDFNQNGDGDTPMAD